MGAIEKFRVGAWGVGAAIVAMISGFVSKPVRAVSCRQAACTYYSSGAPFAGLCGDHNNGGSCQCVATASGNGQDNSVCDLS